MVFFTTVHKGERRLEYCNFLLKQALDLLCSTDALRKWANHCHNGVYLSFINLTWMKQYDCCGSSQPTEGSEPATGPTDMHSEAAHASSALWPLTSMKSIWAVVFILNALLIIHSHNSLLYVSAFLVCFLHHSQAQTVYAKLFRCIYRTSWSKDDRFILVMKEASRLAWKEFCNPITFPPWFSEKQKLSLIDKVVLKGPYLTTVFKFNLFKDLNEKYLIKVISWS